MSKSRSGHSGHASVSREATKASASIETRPNRDAKHASRPAPGVTSWLRAQLSHGDLRESTRPTPKSLNKSRESVVVVDSKKKSASDATAPAAATSSRHSAPQKISEPYREGTIKRKPSTKLRDVSTETHGKKKVALKNKKSNMKEEENQLGREKASESKNGGPGQKQETISSAEEKMPVVVEHKDAVNPTEQIPPAEIKTTAPASHENAVTPLKCREELPNEGRQAPLASTQKDGTAKSSGDNALLKAATLGAVAASGQTQAPERRDSSRSSRSPASSSSASSKTKPKNSSTVSSSISLKPPPEKDKDKCLSSKTNNKGLSKVTSVSSSPSAKPESPSKTGTVTGNGEIKEEAPSSSDPPSQPTSNPKEASNDPEPSAGPQGHLRPRITSTPPLSDTSSVRSPLVRFGKYTVHKLEVPPGRRLLPIGTKYKTRSRSPYLAPLDPKPPKSVAPKPLRSPQQIKRHKKNQKAMARYWQRTEEEEAAWRIEMERRAEQEAERYRAEPPGSPGVLEEDEEEKGLRFTLPKIGTTKGEEETIVNKDEGSAKVGHDRPVQLSVVSEG